MTKINKIILCDPNKTVCEGKDEFLKAISDELADRTFNVQSVDCGGIGLSLFGCTLYHEVETDELVIMKPGTLMEVDIAFDVIDSIIKEDDTYTLTLNNGQSDIEIEVAGYLVG